MMPATCLEPVPPPSMDAPAEHSLAALPRSRKSGPAPWQATLAKLVRRTHLYSGLALVPFVLVYGVSAFLFNHPVGRAPEAAPIPVAEGLRATMPDAEALAAEAATQLGDGAPLAGSASLRGAWTFECERAGRRQRITVAADGASAQVRALVAEPTRSVRLPAATFAAAHAAAERVATAVVRSADGAEDPTTGIRDAVPLRSVGTPTLRYRAGSSEVSVSLERRQATVRDAATFDFGRLLMRLHTAHGYGGGAARVLWAIVVDAMAAAMVLWALSGLFMWWQKRSSRRSGGIVLAGTVVGSIVLVVAMAEVFGA